MKKNTITNEHIRDIMRKTKFESIKMGDKTTVVQATLPNGFVITESSSCVDPDNYDHEVGSGICKERIMNQIWQLEGYLLQVGLFVERMQQETKNSQTSIIREQQELIDHWMARVRVLEREIFPNQEGEG